MLICLVIKSMMDYLWESLHSMRLSLQRLKKKKRKDDWEITAGSEIKLGVTCSLPHSASWPRPVPTPSACLSCAGTTTRNRQLPNFIVSWSSRSSKPSRSPRLSPTVTSSPPLDQDFTLFRHWKNERKKKTFSLQQTYFLNFSTFALFLKKEENFVFFLCLFLGKGRE